MPPIPQDIKEVADELRRIKRDLLPDVYKQREEVLALKTASLLRANEFARRIASLSHITDQYLNNAVQEAVLEVIPFEKIYSVVELQTDGPDAYEDRLVRELLRWFKEDFFTWVNKDTCLCGNTDQNKIQQLGVLQPLAEERRYGAGTVEMYKCDVCGKTYRFPRYNDPIKLVQTRKGRCGEFANCFYAVLKALGLVPVRYVWCQEDHVWTEYYSQNYRRWIHLDSCENAFNEPLLYCNNWGKKMSYVIGVWDNGIVDLLTKYIDARDPSKQLPRNAIGENDLTSLLSYLDARKKRAIEDRDLLYAVHVMDVNEKKYLSGNSLYDNVLVSNRVGRESGNEEWKKERGEVGEVGDQ